ncbi:hypothetical protein YPPY94_0640, partial [Yersinia pestis PY-94]
MPSSDCNNKRVA